MPFTAYLPTSGASFGPDAVASMTKAFEDALVAIGIGPHDETTRCPASAPLRQWAGFA
jgi:hypothetical protein